MSNDQPPRRVVKGLPDVTLLDQTWESATIGKNEPGRLVSLGGDVAMGLAVTIHGINDAPAGVRALTTSRMKQGRAVWTFAWDDNFRFLQDSANDLMVAVRATLAEFASVSLTIDAHSMGARVALVALGRMRGDLTARPVRVNLIAPPLAGYSIADFARLAPHFALDFKNVRPGVDMGSSSPFQLELESVRLPANVKVCIFGAANDTVAPPNADVLRVATRLGVPLTVIADVDHESILDALAGSPLLDE